MATIRNVIIQEFVRRRFLEKIRCFYDSDLIKIVWVNRRQDKEFSWKNFAEEELSKKTKNIVYLNLKYRDINTKNQLLEYVRKHRKDGRCYVFIEDYKHFKEWQETCLALKKENCSVFIKVNKWKKYSVYDREDMFSEYVDFVLDEYTYLDTIKDPYSGFRGDELSRMRKEKIYSKYRSYSITFPIKIKYLDDYDDKKNN